MQGEKLMNLIDFLHLTLKDSKIVIKFIQGVNMTEETVVELT